MTVTFKETVSEISAARSRRVRRAEKVLKKLTSALKRDFSARRIILVGSLTDRERFGFHSDIDLAVEGIPDQLYFRSVGELLMMADEFDVDIIPVERASPKMREKISKGRVLYEEKR